MMLPTFRPPFLFPALSSRGYPGIPLFTVLAAETFTVRNAKPIFSSSDGQAISCFPAGSVFLKLRVLHAQGPQHDCAEIRNIYHVTKALSRGKSPPPR